MLVSGLAALAQREARAGTAEPRELSLYRATGGSSASRLGGRTGRGVSGRPTGNRRAGSATPRRDTDTGRWYFVVDGGVDQDGKRRQVKRRGFPTKVAAQEELDRVRSQARTNSYVAPRRQSVAEFLEKD